jgi:RimJ/RimL family protein N-acetyltransferase
MNDLANWTPRPLPKPVSIEGRTVNLVPYVRAEHAEALWRAFGGAEMINDLLAYFPCPIFETADGFADWLEVNQKTGGWVTEVFINRKTGDVVGMANYMRADPANGVVEVGSVAHGPAMSRTPMATEAHYLMARHVFDDLGYRRYEWKCHNANEPSKKSAVRYGFTFEGLFRQHVISKGANRDTAWFSMIDKEWPLLKAAFEVWLDPENFDTAGQERRKLADIRNAMSAEVRS